jgi:hypothetical protein
MVEGADAWELCVYAYGRRSLRVVADFARNEIEQFQHPSVSLPEPILGFERLQPFVIPAPPELAKIQSSVHLTHESGEVSVISRVQQPRCRHATVNRYDELSKPCTNRV